VKNKRRLEKNHPKGAVKKRLLQIVIDVEVKRSEICELSFTLKRAVGKV